MSFLSWLKRRRLNDEDFDAEIRAHLAIAEEERIADGVDRETAHYAAQKDFGNVLLTTEAARRVWTPRWLESLRDLVSDVRYAVRALAKNAAFSLTVVGVLTLGIGINATVFALLEGMFLSPLPGVDGSSHLIVLYGETSTGRQVRISYPDYQYLRDHDSAFSGLVGSSSILVNLGKGRSARQIRGELVTGNYFQVLGVGAELGRTLTPSDEVAPGRHPVVVLSDSLWRRDFGADPDIVGKIVEINNFTMTVVGVADPRFHGAIMGYDVEAFVPVMMAVEIGLTGGLPPAAAANVLADRRAALLFPHGRLRPGTTLAAAVTQTDAIWTRLSSDRPLTDAAVRLRTVPFWQSPTSGQKYLLPLLSLLSVMGLLVLMIACANIAGLVLVRGLSRRGEIAVRLALGATRARIVRLLIVENLMLATPGALLGVALALRTIPMFVDYATMLSAPDRLFLNVGVDSIVIGFSAFVAFVSVVVFGFVPALQTSRVDLVSVISEDATPRGASRGRLRSGLVVAQVAVSLLLLVGAGLATRSVEAARRLNPGFDANHVTSIAMDVVQNAYDESHGRVFYRNLLNAARADAGVESATLAAYAPLGFLDTRSQRVTVEGYEPRRGEDQSLMSNTVGPDYFRTLRIPVLAGRTFEDRDDETGAPVVIVNSTMAQRFWGSAASAIDKRIKVVAGDWRKVIGVAADVKYARIDEPPRPYFYLPFLQAYRSNMILHTRGTASVDRLVDLARARVTALDPDLPLLYARPLADQARGEMIFYDFIALVLLVAGAAGIALTAMGTYGLVSYTVRQSTREIGIRMAFGAPRLSVVRGFLGRGLRLGAVGAVLGVVAALGVTGLLRSQLFGVSTTDAVSFGRALAIVLGVVVVATIVPAWRAARTNPLNALRHQ